MTSDGWQWDPEYQALLAQRARQRRLLLAIPDWAVTGGWPDDPVAVPDHVLRRIVLEGDLRRRADVAASKISPWLDVAVRRLAIELLMASVIATGWAEVIYEVHDEEGKTPQPRLEPDGESDLAALVFFLACADEVAGDYSDPRAPNRASSGL